MSEPSKEYVEGQTQAMEDDFHGVSPSPFTNPYDPWFPTRAAEWEQGYRDAMKKIKATA